MMSSDTTGAHGSVILMCRTSASSRLCIPSCHNLVLITTSIRKITRYLTQSRFHILKQTQSLQLIIHTFHCMDNQTWGLLDVGLFCTHGWTRNSNVSTSLWLSLNSCRRKWRARTNWCLVCWASPRRAWWGWMRRPRRWSRSGTWPTSNAGPPHPRASPWWVLHGKTGHVIDPELHSTSL